MRLFGQLCFIFLALPFYVTVAAENADWPKMVPNFSAPEAGEHPRLFFRKGDLVELRKRAQSPEGKIILERCKQLLGGATAVRTDKSFTLWDGAAYGFLYQMTEDKKYADLARQCVERAWSPGVVDRDDRYSLNPPNEPMRYGPSLSAIAMAYDLCYDAWEPEFRKSQATKMQDNVGHCKKRGGDISLQRMSMNADCPNTVSNHFGLQVGGAGLTLLAIKGDPGTDDTKIKSWMEGQEKQARKVMTEDFGQTGYFAEHAGPGVISMTWTFTPWLLAERVCAGKDWLSSRPQGLAAEWMSLRFVFETIPVNGKPMYLNPSPQGGYGTDVVEQAGGHHATMFCQGFGAIQPQHKGAMLWVYDNFVQPLESKRYPELLKDGEKSFDIFLYPHRALFALVNWPFDGKAENPEQTIPKAIGDTHFGQFLWRNRWQNSDDICVSALFGARTSDKGVKRLMVWGLGQQMVFCNIPAAIEGNPKVGQIGKSYWQPADDGSGVVTVGQTSIGVDYSKASGADALIVVAGAGADGVLSGGSAKTKATTVKVGDTPMAILSLSTGTHPEINVTDGKAVVGGQSINFVDGHVVFGKIAGPPKISQ